jgi:hypothetical protein
MAREAIHREFPAVLILSLRGPDDLALPRQVTPAFWGSYDWHSAVHGHWTLVRALRREPEAAWADEVRAALSLTLTRDTLAAEHAFVAARPGFERPYGLAWLLQLAAEVRGSSTTAVPMLHVRASGARRSSRSSRSRSSGS